MAAYSLRLFTDQRPADAGPVALAPGCNRVLYLVEGSASITAGGAVATLAPNSAWSGPIAAEVQAGAKGMRLLRFELVPGDGRGGAGGTPTLLAPVTLDPAQPYLIRCDRVDFPPGGIAYRHTHQGPGIRCLQSGSIRIETAGTAHDYAAGEAWFESGPDPVLAIASERVPSHFIRVMILPRALLGKSSIRYVNAEDKDKPKRQSYQIFVDAPIELQ